MKYVLFICSRVGYESLNTLLKLNCNVVFVFIEKEHEHEFKKYYKKSIELCESANISYLLNPNKKETYETIISIDKIDYLISFGYRKMISDNITKIPKVAALGTHFSPLPRYRGFAPLNWALINGEHFTAVNMFYLDKKVDSGDVISKKRIKIDYKDDINTLYNKSIEMLKILLIETIPKLESISFKAEKQNEFDATYTVARNPFDGYINWQMSSEEIYNMVRGITYPFPGAFTYINEEKLIIWSCEDYKIPKFEGIVPGKVIEIKKGFGVVVLCGKGAVLIKEVETKSGERKTADKCLKSIRQTLGKMD